MSMDRNAVAQSASSASAAHADNHELILIIEAMHLGRGTNDATLKKISQGAANKARKRYLVAHLPLHTESGDSAMRTEVARQAHLLIQHHKPHKVIIATDYNLGRSGGSCTLQEFSELLTNPGEDLMLPPILIDSQSIRAQRDSTQQALVKEQNQTKNLILVNYVLFGGNLAELGAACEEFADGKFSNWTTWRGLMTKSMRPSTPDAKSLATRQPAPHADLASSTPSLAAINELGNIDVNFDILDVGTPMLVTRTLSLPAQTRSASDNEDQPLESPYLSSARSPVSVAGSFSSDSQLPSASPEEISIDSDIEYELSHIVSTPAAGMSAGMSAAPKARLFTQPHPILPKPAARFTNRHEDDNYHYHALLGRGHLEIPKKILFNHPKKQRELTRSNSLEAIKQAGTPLAESAKPMPTTTSPAAGFNGISPSRFTTSQTGKGSPAGMFARRLAAISTLRVDVTSPRIDGTPDFDESPITTIFSPQKKHG